MTQQKSQLIKPPYPFVKNDGSVQARNLIGWWPGTGGGQSWDFSGGRRNLVLTNFPAPFTQTSGWTFGVDGGISGIIFDGTDDCVQLTHAQSSSFCFFTSTQAYSLSFWIKVADVAPNLGFVGGCRVFFDGNGWYCYWVKSDRSLHFGYQGINDQYQERDTTTGKIPYATWTHVVLTRDSTNTTAGMKAYINGIPDPGTVATNGTPTDCNYLVAGGTPMLGFGKNPQSTAFPFTGALEDIRLYSRALSAADAFAMYNPTTRWDLRYQPGCKKYFSVPPPAVTEIVESASNSLTFTQTVAKFGTVNLVTGSTLALTHTNEVRGPIYVSASNTIGFTQSQRGYDETQSASSTITFVSAALKAQDWSRSVTNTLLFLNVADVTKLRLTSNTLTFSQLADVEQTRGTFDTLVLTQSATVQLDPHNESIQQILILDHSAVGSIERNFALSSTLTLTGVATVQRWRYASAFSVLPITQNLIPIRIASVTSTITFTQSATAITEHTRRVFSNLAFTDSATRIADYARSAENTLVFNEQFHQVRDQSGGYITQPILIGIIVPRLVILQIPGLAITLPRPLLGDAEAGLNSIDIKRTETDETYTYVRRSIARSLKYKFSITRAKAYEMRNFVQKALASKITMTNWKGELWYGNLMNNPFEFTGQGRASPCGEVWEIDFEFEGVRLN